MNLLKVKAQEVADLAASKKGLMKLDPILIALIIQIISEIIAMWQSCRKKPEEAVDNAKNPGILTMWIVRRLVNRHLDGQEVKAEVRAALYEVGGKLTANEVSTMYAEVKG